MINKLLQLKKKHYHIYYTVLFFCLIFFFNQVEAQVNNQKKISSKRKGTSKLASVKKKKKGLNIFSSPKPHTQAKSLAKYRGNKSAQPSRSKVRNFRRGYNRASLRKAKAYDPFDYGKDVARVKVRVRKNQSSKAASSFGRSIKIKRRKIKRKQMAAYTGGPVNPFERAKYRNQILKNTRKRPKIKPKKRKAKKLRHDPKESKIWN